MFPKDAEATLSNSTSAADRPHNLPEPEQGDKPPSHDITVQRNAELLAECGIKTRDFAYESKLPPIRSVPHIPVQRVRPRASPLKRKRQEDDEPADDYEGQTFSFDAEKGGTTIGLRPRKKPRQVERTPTEPADIEEPPPAVSPQPMRTYGYANMPSFVRRPRRTLRPASQARTPPRATPSPTSAPVAGPSQAVGDVSPSQGESQGTSQDTDGWVPTPLMTPQGSLHERVDVSSAIPASQLDTPSGLPPPEDVTYSQLGFTPDRSPSQVPRRCSPPPSPIRALAFTPTSGTPSGSSPSPPSPPPARRRRAPAPASANTRGSLRKTRQHDVSEPTTSVRTSRYNLRERTRIAPVRATAAIKSRVVRAMSSRQDAVGKCPSPGKKGKAAQSSPPKRGAMPSPSKRAAKSSPPKRTTRKTAKQALLG
ncbi:hypothetical protein DAEQUDRAFT_763690 [Daedalea quercina L-15889]|uniref:Uncharacterized protein n=1 Tax=Daedalea quercina L-15889 TaxID=1314783 RepID=A0A165S2Q1_9APHY|nr:hypothetical protein DAEQUDRAFT_763690 [Daedalea quercina L-15889]